MNIGKDNLIISLEQERAIFEKAISTLSARQLVEIKIVDDWSCKDIIAHITAWEVELLLWLDQASKGTAPAIPNPGEWGSYIETFNKDAYFKNRECSLEEVLRRSGLVYKQVLAAFLALPDDDEDQYWSAWLNGEPPWILFATYYEHYREHVSQIKAWLAQQDNDIGTQ